MGLVDSLTLKIKRGETPFYRTLSKLIRSLLYANVPVPAPLKPVFAAMYEFHMTVFHGIRMLRVYVYWQPLFRSRCTSVGKNLHLTLFPRVRRRPVIRLGNNVKLYGELEIVGAGRPDECELVVGDAVQIGHRVTILIGNRVTIEEGAGISSECYISDVEAIPHEFLDPATPPLSPEEAKPVRICARAWIGRGSAILKGVTIGEGALITSGSVVVSDVPPFCVAMGNPARVVVRHNFPSPGRKEDPEKLY
jgi:acetyltransferase-like isoleucine patch superfamily enzyme